MIKSMTGFGKHSGEFGNKKFTIEIRSLNAKQMDISTRIPNVYKEKDMFIRSTISKNLDRGKIDFSLSFELLGNESEVKLNKRLAKAYYEQFKELGAELELPLENAMSILVKMPDVLKGDKEQLDPTEWKAIEGFIKETLVDINSFRSDEGASLEADLLKRIQAIGVLLEEVAELDPKRMAGVRERIEGNLEQFIGKGKFDENRMEQELIFYIEKLDISEEKVRLKAHLDYFMEILNADTSNGKKLGFIAQEIGREINTIGSKANYADIQKVVVQMKDNLEKIKEQVLNVL